MAFNNVLRPLLVPVSKVSRVSASSKQTLHRSLSTLLTESIKVEKSNNDTNRQPQGPLSLQKWHQSKSCYSTTSSTPAPSPTPTRDTRMAGRRRFYKIVDIIQSSPPWEAFEDDNDTKSMDNPISAGVDGTNSASNISLEKPSRTSVQLTLTPSSISNGNTDSDTDTNTDIMESGMDWYGITLDGRQMKTPLGMPLAVPSLSLALSIASEWDDQKLTIQPAQMPIMTLVCTTIDQLTIPSVKDATIDKILSYLKNDTTCYYADETEDRILYRRQNKAWDKLHQWISTTNGKSKSNRSRTSTSTSANASNNTDDNDEIKIGLGFKPAIAMGAGEGLIMSRMRKTSNKVSAGLPHEEKMMENAKEFLTNCDGWTLAAMQNVTMEAKSFLVGMAVVQGVQYNSGPFAFDTSKAVVASRVEEEFQIESWGLVEGGHDYDRLNCNVQIHAASALMESIVSENNV